MEKWKWIKNYTGYYKVSNYGRVISFHGPKPKILSNRDNGKGYFIVSLYKNGNCKNKRINRLVAEHFIPNPETKPEVNHIDGDKANNHVENLEWVTRSENRQHAIKNNLWKSHFTKNNGESHPDSKLTKNDVKKIRDLYENGDYTQKELGKMYDVYPSTIGRITRYEHWKHI